MMRAVEAALRKAWTMSWQDRRLLLEAGSLAVLMEIALRVLPFNKLLARLDAVDAPPDKIAAASSRQACERAVDFAYRALPLTRTCLKESLVLLRMLRGRGVTSRLCLGVRKSGGRFAAHAWVEHDGTPLERLDESYAPLPVPHPCVPSS